MYNKIQVIRKLLIGAVALAAAICITIFIRENMDVKDPEQALPSITITMNGTTAMAPESIRAWKSLVISTRDFRRSASASPGRLSTVSTGMPRRVNILDRSWLMRGSVW